MFDVCKIFLTSTTSYTIIISILNIENRKDGNMIRFLEEIRDDSGYYYVNEKLDLNDFVILIAFMIISFALVVVEYIYSLQEITPETIIIFAMICIIFCSPFLAHFLVKGFKIITFRRKKKKILTHGDMYIAKLVDSKKGPCLFKDNITETEKFSYYPIVEYYDNNGLIRLTSPYAVNNTYMKALSSQQVTIYIYKKAFILSDFAIADSKENSLSHRNSRYKDLSEILEKANRIYATYLICYLIFINIIRLLLKYYF